MENIKEIRTLLTEEMFTNVCKIGFVTIRSIDYGKTDINFHKVDILQLVKGEIVTKEIGTEIFKFALQDLGTEMIREIVKRSPIFYELSNQF
jgi:hypothetical protein